jgi:hypothetical protein
MLFGCANRSFRPEVLTCRPKSKDSLCLTLPCLDLLKKLYTPLADAEQNHVFSALTPGAEYWFYDRTDDLLTDWRWPHDGYRGFLSDTEWMGRPFLKSSGTLNSIDRTFNPAEIDVCTCYHRRDDT